MGDLRYLSGSLVPLFDENGNYDGMACTVEDITAHKIAEKTLVESENKFKTLFNNTNDGIFIINLDGNFLEVNRVICENLGYSRGEMLQMMPMDIDILHDKLKVSERINEISENGHSIFETVHVRRDGSTMPVELSNRLIKYEGKPAILIIARDITERKMAEEKLKKYAEELSNANEELKSLDLMKDEFLSNISHELKTPLISIIGYNDLIYDETLGPLNEKQKKAMDTVVRNSKRLKQLIDSLLYMSAFQAGKIRYTFQPI